MMRFNDMFHNAEPDANTLGFTTQLGSAPVEAFENLPVFVRRNAVAVILDEEDDS